MSNSTSDLDSKKQRWFKLLSRLSKGDILKSEKKRLGVKNRYQLFSSEDQAIFNESVFNNKNHYNFPTYHEQQHQQDIPYLETLLHPLRDQLSYDIFISLLAVLSGRTFIEQEQFIDEIRAKAEEYYQIIMHLRFRDDLPLISLLEIIETYLEQFDTLVWSFLNRNQLIKTHSRFGNADFNQRIDALVVWSNTLKNVMMCMKSLDALMNGHHRPRHASGHGANPPDEKESQNESKEPSQQSTTNRYLNSMYSSSSFSSTSSTMIFNASDSSKQQITLNKSMPDLSLFSTSFLSPSPTPSSSSSSSAITSSSFSSNPRSSKDSPSKSCKISFLDDGNISDSMAERMLKLNGLKGTFNLKLIKEIQIFYERFKVDSHIHSETFSIMNLPSLDKPVDALAKFPICLLHKMLLLQIQYIPKLLKKSNSDTSDVLTDLKSAIGVINEIACDVPMSIIKETETHLVIKDWLEMYFKLLVKTLDQKAKFCYDFFKAPHCLIKEWESASTLLNRIGYSVTVHVDTQFWQYATNILSSNLSFLFDFQKLPDKLSSRSLIIQRSLAKCQLEATLNLLIQMYFKQLFLVFVDLDFPFPWQSSNQHDFHCLSFTDRVSSISIWAPNEMSDLVDLFGGKGRSGCLETGGYPYLVIAPDFYQNKIYNSSNSKPVEATSINIDFIHNLPTPRLNQVVLLVHAQNLKAVTTNWMKWVADYNPFISIIREHITTPENKIASENVLYSWCKSSIEECMNSEDIECMQFLSEFNLKCYKFLFIVQNESHLQKNEDEFFCLLVQLLFHWLDVLCRKFELCSHFTSTSISSSPTPFDAPSGSYESTLYLEKASIEAILFCQELLEDNRLSLLTETDYNGVVVYISRLISHILPKIDIHGCKSRAKFRGDQPNLFPISSASELALLYGREPSSKDLSLCSDASQKQEQRYRCIQQLESELDRKSLEAKWIGSVMRTQSEYEKKVTEMAGLSNASYSIKWQIGRWLGAGADGSVYMGINLESGQVMAVKEFKFRDLASVVRVRKVLTEEVDMFSVLRHENLVEYYGSEVHRDKLYVFMEYCPISLADCLKENTKMRNVFALEAATRYILKGINYLHEKKIVHRDIKPANILIGYDGKLKLTDFASSKFLLDYTRKFSEKSKLSGAEDIDIATNPRHLTTLQTTNTLVGTCYYLAPEVITGKQSNIYAQDIWALGCCVIEMATGKAPWSELDNEWAILFKIGASEDIPALPSTSDVSVNGIDFLEKCFLKDPKLRPNANELLNHVFCADVGEMEEDMLREWVNS